MADGGQRLLDVIDDPNALESFLGGLTSDSELLPSAESVDNVVASLARSLEGDYEVDSPNDTLFDTLEPSTNTLTDISQSYVPSDFDNVNMSNVGGPGTYNSMGSLPNGEITHQVHHQQQQHDLQNSLSSVVASGTEQYLISTNQSSSSNSISSNVTGSLQQFTSNNSNCDSSSIVSTTSAVATSGSQFVQQHQQIQISQNQILLQNSGNHSTYVFNQELLQKQTMVNQTQQMTSLSHSNVDSQNSNNSSMNNMISVSISNNNDGRQGMGSTFQQQQQGNEMSQQGQMQVISQGQLTSNTNSNVSIVNVNTSNNSSVSSTTANNEMSCNVTGNSNSITSSTSNTMQQQYVASATQQQTTTLNQLMSGQTVSLANVNVGGAQIIGTSTGNIVTTGQGQANIIQQIQSANGGQYITVDQPTTALIAAGPTAFGGNLALVTTGGASTYAVVPSGTQFLSNAIMTQPQAIQTITKGPNGTYYQTTGGAQLVATSNVNAIQNVNVTVANANINKPKQPPQLLPKPQANGGASNNQGTVNASIANSSSNSVSTDTVSSSSVTSTNTTQASGTVTTPSEGVITQIFQQQQTAQIQGIQNQVVVTSVGNSVGSVTIPQQPSFSIGNAGIGQVVVSQNPTQQTQLTGTIVLNQYGQPMLLPSASTGQAGGLQFIVRQQPQQPQVLTFQAPAGTATIGAQTATQGKPIIRYVSQMPQVAQSGGYGLQQIQTPNGPAWVAVRYPQPATTITTSAGQISQIQETLIPTSTVQTQITNQQHQQIQVQVQAQQQQIISSQQQTHQHQQQVHVAQHQTQVIQQQPQVVQVQQHQPQVAQPQTPQPKTPQPQSQPATPPVHHQPAQVATPDSSSSEPPPAKKSKSRAKSNKKKVCLDLEQLLKQSGIMDEDLQDDSSFDFNFSSQDDIPNGFSSSPVQQSQPAQNQSSIQQSPVQVNQSPVQHPAVNTSGKSKSKNETATPKKPPAKSRKKRKRSPSPPPPPPPPPPKGKGSRKRGGNKADSKTDKNKAPPKKLSSIDSVSATIMAVAAGTPSPPLSPAPTSSLPHTPSSPAVTPSSIRPVTPVPSPSPSTPGSGSMTPNGLSPMPPQPGTTRIVHTIQLSTQNQHLLRNIQTQISRLLQLPKRNETEQTALQKLIVLQQQVIATGIPVPNPSHIANLPPNVNASASSTVLPASTFSSTAPVTTSGGTPGESLISTSSSSNTTASNVTNLTSLPQNNNNAVSLPTNQSSSSSNAAKLQNSKVSVNTNAASTVTVKAVNSTNSVTPVDSTTNESNINTTSGSLGKVIQASPSGVGKVVMPNVNSDSSVGPQIPEENKENTTGGSGMVVASSNFATATNTTNSLGQHHFQSYSSNFRNTIDEKKAEEQRLANQKAEEEKRARWKKEEFEMLLKRDQQCVVKPDYEIPFSSKRDAVERLMKYHILRDKNDMNFDEFDSDFGEKASVLLDKFHGMIAKHRSLLLKESMKEVGCAERVMLERMFVAEEKLKLEQDRLLVSQGEVLELSPPPASWVPKIKEMVDKEVKELERDSYVNQQVQSAIDSIIGFGNNDPANFLPEEGDKVEYDAFGVPINNGAYSGMNSSSSADIDEAVRSILS